MKLKKGAVCIVLDGRGIDSIENTGDPVHFFPVEQIILYEGGDRFTGITIHGLNTDRECIQYIPSDRLNVEVIGYL